MIVATDLNAEPGRCAGSIGFLVRRTVRPRGWPARPAPVAPAAPVPDGTGLPSGPRRLGFRPVPGGRLAPAMEHQPNPQHVPATVTAGRAVVLATYRCDEGVRELVAQRINGRVALSDIPADGEGKVYLIERHLAYQAELKGIISDYTKLGERLGRPPLRGDWILE
jgi:hypothetical protein